MRSHTCPTCHQNLIITVSARKAAPPGPAGWQVFQSGALVARPVNKAAVLRVLDKLGTLGAAAWVTLDDCHVTREELER
jgi:hypothetical protein